MVKHKLGSHTKALRDEKADVWSYEPEGQYLFREKVVPERTFFECIQRLPKELHGSFDLALQYRYMAQPFTIETAARALKKNGIYVATFHEGQIGWFDDDESSVFESRDSDEAKVIKELFKKARYINLGHPLGRMVKCIASDPVFKAK